jgi:hypothetical protein
MLDFNAGAAGAAATSAGRCRYTRRRASADSAYTVRDTMGIGAVQGREKAAVPGGIRSRSAVKWPPADATSAPRRVAMIPRQVGRSGGSQARDAAPIPAVMIFFCLVATGSNRAGECTRCTRKQNDINE